jgi:hypothetical protein
VPANSTISSPPAHDVVRGDRGRLIIGEHPELGGQHTIVRLVIAPEHIWQRNRAGLLHPFRPAIPDDQPRHQDDRLAKRPNPRRRSTTDTGSCPTVTGISTTRSGALGWEASNPELDEERIASQELYKAGLLHLAGPPEEES